MNTKFYRNIVHEFCECTSIHGIIYVFQRKLSKIVRVVWAAIFILMCLLCFAKSHQNIVEYLKFDVKTSTTLKIENELMFPEIMFCSYYIIKKSEIGNYSAMPILLASLAAHNKEQFYKYIPEMRRTCESSNISPLVKLFNQIGINAVYENETKFIPMFRNAMTTFNKDAMKCWWSGNERNCSDFFVNTNSDVGYCFLLNPGKKFAKMEQVNFGGYGLNLDKYDENEFRLKNWASDKFHLLLNANQDEYCGKSFLGNHGAGFFALISETDSLPTISYDAPLLLTPGYTNNVILRPSVHRRHTEHLGLCSSYVDLFLFPEANKYIQTLCLAQCTAIHILKRCNCYPYQYAALHDLLLANVEKIGIKNSVLRLCREEELLCPVSFYFDVFVKESQSTMCPLCKVPCFEKKYSFQVTRALLSLSSLKRDLVNSSFMSEEDLRKNYLYVNIGYENKEVMAIEEKQAITVVDLFIFLGNNIGLFLGMSFMSNFEVLINIFLRMIANINFREFCNKLISRECRTQHVEHLSFRQNSVVLREYTFRRHRRNRTINVSCAL